MKYDTDLICKQLNIPLLDMQRTHLNMVICYLDDPRTIERASIEKWIKSLEGLQAFLDLLSDSLRPEPHEPV